MARNKAPDDNAEQDKGRRYGLSLDALLSIPGLAGQTIGKALGQSGNLLAMLMKTPDFMEQVGKAGRYLKDLREVAGLTLEDLARAVDIKDPAMLRAVEEGRSPITLDILFRLSSFYSRNDPFAFMVSFSRQHAPWLWQILRLTGVEKLLITMERELKFINIYRSRDSARHLSDEEFDKMLGFVRGGFDMAMDFIEPTMDNGRPSRRKTKSTAPEKAPPGAAADTKTADRSSRPTKGGSAKKPSTRKAPTKK